MKFEDWCIYDISVDKLLEEVDNEIGKDSIVADIENNNIFVENE